MSEETPDLTGKRVKFRRTQRYGSGEIMFRAGQEATVVSHGRASGQYFDLMLRLEDGSTIAADIHEIEVIP